MISSGVCLFRQLNAIADTRNAFKSEKRTVLLTMIFFCLSFLTRIVTASLELAGVHSVVTLAEVPLVQLEIFMTVIND